MEAYAEYNMKKSNGFEEMNSKVKDWVPPHVMTDFTDHKKQKHLVVVGILPMGFVHFNTTNKDIEVASMQDELQIKIIWPNNMMDVMKLLSQFLHKWYADDINMQQHLAMKKAFNQLRKKASDFVWSKVCTPISHSVSLRSCITMTMDSVH